MMASHSSTKLAPGGDGRTEDGSNIPKLYPSSQKNQKLLDHAELITREWSKASVPSSLRTSSQDARSEKPSTCGLVPKTAASLVVNSSTLNVITVNLIQMINGEEWPSASMSQRSLEEVSSVQFTRLILREESKYQLRDTPTKPSTSWTTSMTRKMVMMTIKTTRHGSNIHSTHQPLFPESVYGQLERPSTTSTSLSAIKTQREDSKREIWSESHNLNQAPCLRSDFGLVTSATSLRLNTSLVTAKLKNSTSVSSHSIKRKMPALQSRIKRRDLPLPQWIHIDRSFLKTTNTCLLDSQARSSKELLKQNRLCRLVRKDRKTPNTCSRKLHLDNGKDCMFSKHIKVTTWLLMSLTENTKIRHIWFLITLTTMRLKSGSSRRTPRLSSHPQMANGAWLGSTKLPRYNFLTNPNKTCFRAHQSTRQTCNWLHAIRGTTSGGSWQNHD